MIMSLSDDPVYSTVEQPTAYFHYQRIRW